MPPPRPAGLLGTRVGAVPMHSWAGASCGDAPSLPPSSCDFGSLTWLSLESDCKSPTLVTAVQGRGWKWMIFEVTSNPNQSGIL